MKKITLSLITLFFVSMFVVKAQEECVSVSTFLFYTTNAGWSDSEWYKIIDIDAESLTDATLPQHSGMNGTNTSTNFGTGNLPTPIYTYNESTSAYEPAGFNWPVKYYMACFAPAFLNSASTKVQELGSAPSKGSPVECTNNNNTVLPSPIWDKKGFIELSRQGATGVSLHGYLEIDDLPMVERIQWSFSSTGYKRGVKMDIKYNNGEWEPLQWVPSNLNNFATFAEQGYQFENIIGKQDDPESKISVRWRIWDGDSIHVNPMTSSTFSPINPLAQHQVVRIHQIKVFAGMVPTEAPNAVLSPSANAIQYFVTTNKIQLSEDCQAELYSIEGKKVLSVFGNELNVSNLQKGIYILKAQSSVGLRLTKKIKL